MHSFLFYTRKKDGLNQTKICFAPRKCRINFKVKTFFSFNSNEI